MEQLKLIFSASFFTAPMKIFILVIIIFIVLRVLHKIRHLIRLILLCLLVCFLADCYTQHTSPIVTAKNYINDGKYIEYVYKASNDVKNNTLSFVDADKSLSSLPHSAKLDEFKLKASRSLEDNYNKAKDSYKTATKK